MAQLSKESARNVGDLGWIPGLERSPGEGKGDPLQYSGLKNSMDCIAHGVTKSQTRLSDFGSFPVAQTVKNLPAMQETRVQLLGGEDPLEKGTATHSSILPGESHGQRSRAGHSPWVRKQSDMTEQLTLQKKKNTITYNVS